MTPQFKEECKNSANCNRLGKVFYDTDKEISYDNTLASLEFVEDCYVNGSVLGTVNTKGLTVNTIGKEDLYNKDIDAKIGVKYGDSSEEYINIGKYTVDKPNDQETANLGQYKAYDYLDKLNEDYACNITDWADITVADIYEDLCEQSGLTPETLEFDNSDIPVTGDIFEEGYKRKDILSDIAELAGSFVDIDKDTNVVKLKRLETNVENTVSGNSDIYIDDALNHSIYDMKIDGNTSQNTTTGKNLLSDQFKFEDQTINGVTIKNNGDGSFDLTGTANDTFNIYSNYISPCSETLLKPGTYYQSCCTRMSLVNENGTWVMNTWSNPSLTEDLYINVLFISVTAGETYNKKYWYQIEEGNSFTDYEEYTGGEPSPNPDYPQEITTIKDSVKLLQVGKNKLKIEDQVITSSGITFTFKSGVCTLSGTASANEIYCLIENTNFTINAGTYTCNNGSGNPYPYVSLYYDNSYHQISVYDDNGIKKFDLDKDIVVTKIRFYFNKNSISNTTIFSPQIEKGDVATDFDAYKEKEYIIDLQGNELSKLNDDIKDKLLIDSQGNVILQKNIRHLSLAIADMNNSTNYPGWKNIEQLQNDYPNINGNLSTVASFKNNITSNIKAFGINTLQNGGLLFIIKSIIDLTQEEWLAQYPDLVLELYYSLQNTETVDLGKIQNFKTYDGVNHFFLETNLSTNFEIRYAQNIHNASIEPVSTLSKDNYSSLTKNQKYGPVNSLVIKESEAEGENVSLQDDNSIAINGETQVNIVDNIFLYTPELRQQAIDKIWNAISGLTYYDCKIESYTGLPYLNKGDRISVEDDAGNYFDTYVLKHTFTYDGTFKSVIESPALTLQETKIKSPVSLGQMLTQTRINVDKANKNINLLNSQVSDTNSKIAEINIDLSEISQSVVEINNENASIKESLNDYATNDTVTQQINSVEQKITSNNLKIDVIEETLENGVSKVKTETGFTFDNNGLNISSSDSKVNNTLSEIGMEIEDNSTGETLLFAGFDNELQETVVISKNLTVEKYLNIPHARFEGYDNPDHGMGTGCFYIE